MEVLKDGGRDVKFLEAFLWTEKLVVPFSDSKVEWRLAVWQRGKWLYTAMPCETTALITESSPPHLAFLLG